MKSSSPRLGPSLQWKSLPTSKVFLCNGGPGFIRAERADSEPALSFCTCAMAFGPYRSVMRLKDDGNWLS